MKNSLEKRGPLKKIVAIVAMASAILFSDGAGAQEKDGVPETVLTGMRMQFARALSGEMMRKCKPHQLDECSDRVAEYALEEWDAEGMYAKLAEERNWCGMTEEDFNDLMEQRQLVWGTRGWPRERVLGSYKYCSRRFEEDLYQAIDERAGELLPTDIRVEIRGESPISNYQSPE